MSRIRPFLRVQGILAIAIFFAWLGTGFTHQHAEAPACQVCKLLHHGAADLTPPVASSTPHSPGERVAIIPTDAPADRFLPLLRGRPPPLA